MTEKKFTKEQIDQIKKSKTTGKEGFKALTPRKPPKTLTEPKKVAPKKAVDPKKKN